MHPTDILLNNIFSKKILGPLFDDLIFLKQLDGKAKEQGLDRYSYWIQTGFRKQNNRQQLFKQLKQNRNINELHSFNNYLLSL